MPSVACVILEQRFSLPNRNSCLHRFYLQGIELHLSMDPLHVVLVWFEDDLLRRGVSATRQQRKHANMTAAIKNLIRCERDQSKVMVPVQEELVNNSYVAWVRWV